MRKLALYGAGALGMTILETLIYDGALFATYDELFFVDDNPSITLTTSISIVDFPKLLVIASAHDVEIAICVSNPHERYRLATRVLESQLKLATIVGPNANVSPNIRMGKGCIVAGRSTVCNGSSLADNSLVLDAYISAECDIGESCVIMPGAVLARRSHVHRQSIIDCAATLGEGVHIGSRVKVEAGSAVFEDVGDNLTVRGNPAFAIDSEEPFFYR